MKAFETSIPHLACGALLALSLNTSVNAAAPLPKLHLVCSGVETVEIIYGTELDPQETMAAMQAADAALQAALQLAASPPGMVPVDLPVTDASGLDLLPLQPPTDHPLPWLQRRLQAAVHDSQAVARAARRVLAKLG